MSTTTRTPARSRASLRRAGLWCLAAGIVGAAQAVILLAWSPQVPDTRFSYPFYGVGYAVAQASFFLQHLPLIAGLVALLTLPAVRASRAARVGTRAAALGLVLLAVTDLVAISAYDASTESDHAALVENLYGPSTVLVAIGLVVAGLALVRGGTAAWPGARWLPAVVLALGVYVFVPLTPAIMGSFTAGRLGIGGWMLLFAALGYGLTRLNDPAQGMSAAEPRPGAA